MRDRYLSLLAVVCLPTLAISCGGDREEASATGSGTLTFTTTASSDSNGTDTTTDTAGTSSDTGEKFDVGNQDGGVGPGDCGGGGGGMGEPAFSYIWIANSPEGTVSKIDTYTGTELGRYITGPEAVREPSRTSVNLYGDAAVANRGDLNGGTGSVTKIAAREEDCFDTNNNGTIDTSTGPTDVKPWGQDECVMWNLPIPSDMYQHGPRPLAWEGKVTQNGCASPNPRLWVGWYDYGANTGKFHRVDGSTGTVLDNVDIPNWTGLNYGPYGGAVDGDGNFWASGWQKGHLIKIDGSTLQYEVFPFPNPPSGQQWSYGMALDQYGNPWIASSGPVAYFDAASKSWGWVDLGHLSIRGVMVDREDRAWFAVDGGGSLGTEGCGLGIVDVANRTVLAPKVQLPGCVQPVGISIDVEGYVWVVDQGANTAFKVDPDTWQVQLSVGGLNAPYTYSDMTGGGLDLVTNPPQG